MATWYQQQLTPPDVLECNIRLGVIPSQDHLQWLVELKDPQSGILIGQESGPHRKIRDLPEVLLEVLHRAQRLLDEASEPF